MRICLHIGRPRTGTTSFQAGMARSRDALRTSGVSYPSTSEDDPRHMQLFWAAAGSGRLRHLRRWHAAHYDGLDLTSRIQLTMAESEAAHTLVLSSEWFSMPFPPETFRVMIGQLQSFGPVTVFVTLRHQADAIVSTWVRQVLDRVNVGPLSEMTAVRGDWGKTEQPMNNLALVQGWARHCGVVALPYGPDAPHTLAAAMGIANVMFVRDPPGPPLSLCEFLRRKSRSFASRAEWKAFVAEVTAEPQRFAAHRDAGTLEAAAAIRARFIRAFERSNRMLAEQFSCGVEPGRPDYD